jgi:Zn-dependent protease with chaperone function
MVMVTDHLESPMVFAMHWSGAFAIICSVLALILVWIRTARKKIFTELETGRLPIDLIQKTYVRAQHGLRVLALAGQVLLMFGTQWPDLVRSVFGVHIAGLDELVMLLPFITWIMGGYFFLYAADRAIREAMLGAMLYIGQPVHPIWTRTQYVAFQMQFQLLLIGFPLFLIIVAKDLVDIWRKELISLGAVVLSKVHLRMFAELTPDGLLAVIAGIIFIFAPFLVKWVWRARSLPAGELRTSLTRIGKNAGLWHRDVLLWPTYGVIVNAAVVGLWGPVRYIMLSDGLIESLTDGQIEAVFGHEIGHVKLHHLPFFLVFALTSMILIGLGGWQLQVQLGLSVQMTELVVLSAVMAVWFLAFGFISRRFEAQADLFGVKLLSGEFDRGGCTNPACLRHNGLGGDLLGAEPLCVTGAELFSSALDRTAGLNAVPKTARSWRHGSIAHRCRFVVHAAEHLPTYFAFRMQIWWIKIGLVLGLAASIFLTVWWISHLREAPLYMR